MVKEALAFTRLRRSSRPMLRPGLALIALPLFWAVPISAATNDNPFGATDPYQACVAAVDANAADAFEMASIWRDHGGGGPAAQCIAPALISLHEPRAAASRRAALAPRQGSRGGGGRAPVPGRARQSLRASSALRG